MKLLSIIRHGRSEPLDSTGDDFHRCLLPKGRKDLHRLKKPLAKIETAVDLITASPAARAQQSAEYLAEQIGYSGRILIDEEIYEAAPSTLLQRLSNLPEDAAHVLLIGHNPGVEGLISGLCAGSSRRMNVSMPAAGMAHLHLEIYWWQQIRWGCGILQALLRPKYLAKK